MVDPIWAHARRILLVRLDNLGDVLLTTPAFRAVRQTFPDAELHLLTSRVGSQVGKLNPDVDRVITYQAPWVDPWNEIEFDPQRELSVVRQITAERYDAAIIFTSFRQSSLPAAYLSYLAGIPLRLGASIDASGSLLTTRHKHPDCLMHEVERGLDLVNAVGISSGDRDLVLSAPNIDVSALLARSRVPDIESTGPSIVIHPGCSMPARTYPWEMYSEVGDLLVEQLDATVILTGAADEQDLVERLKSRMTRPATSLAGALSFPELCGLINGVDLVITNNTGPMHIASATKTPVVALFALTNPPEQWGPWRVPHRLLNVDVPCRICYQRTCPYEHQCLQLVSPGAVLEAADSLLDATDSQTRGTAGGRLSCARLV